MPDYASVHKELQRSGVTLNLLWLEYCDQCRAAGEIPYQSTQFNKYYADYLAKVNATMHLNHKPGEVMQVDWAGDTAAVIDTDTGEIIPAYTFIDNLTGGKLSEIRGKFSTAMSNIVQGISQKFTDARTAFSNGLNNIKNAVSGAVTWFFESGKRIVSTFANGIKSAFSSAVEAVKGGLQKIRNLLPFSDAKEGPLSTLTLSGQRTMTTYAHGLTLAGDAPAEAMNKSLQQVQGALDRKPEKKVDLGGGKKDKDESSDEGGSGKGKQVIIHKLLVPVDLKKIKDLQQLLALLQEVEDYAAANEDGEPGDDEDAVPAPA